MRNRSRYNLRNLPNRNPTWYQLSRGDESSDDDSDYSSNIQNSDSSDTSIEDNIMADEVFTSNPYAGNINPGTTAGAKLFHHGTVERSETDLLSAKVSTAKEFIDSMRQDATAFSWGILTSKIEHASFGGDTKNVLVDFTDLDVDKVRSHMGKIFFHATDPIPSNYTANTMFSIDCNAADNTIKTDSRQIFYKRVRANMIGRRIIGSLTKTAKKNLFLKKSQFLWKDDSGEEFYDGVTMLQILVTQVKPTTNVGVYGLKTKIRNCKLSNFGHNVHEMIDTIEDYVQQISDQNGSYDDLMYDTLNALLTTKNDEFRSFIRGEKDKFDIGDELQFNDLTSRAKAKYNNLVLGSKWKENAGDSKIVALATQVEQLKKELGAARNSSKNENKNTSKVTLNVAEWRKTKSHGDSVNKDGKQWWWCPHQHNHGKGMYVTHPPDKHVSWKEKKLNNKDNDKDSKKDANKKTMTLSDNLKAAMVSKFKCSLNDAEELWKSVCKDQSN